MPETTPAASPLDPSVVGTTFMRQYYQLLAKDPQSLHRFYKDESRWCHGRGSQMETPFAGQRAINEQILKRGYAGARVDLDLGSIDCQGSLDGGVVVLVTGVMTLPASPQPKPFVQTFFLAVQPKGYFVLNDCLRFLELPGAASATVAVAADKPKAPTPAAKDDKKPVAPPAKAPASPVKKSQPEPAASPVKKAPVSPVKKEQTPVKKEQTPAKKADKAPQKLPETKAAEPAVTPPVASPKKKAPASPVKDKAVASPAAAPVAAPVAAPAEPAAPKTWAALFNKTAAAPAAAPAAPVSAPAAAPAAAPAPASAPAAAAAPAEGKTASPSKAGEPSKERPRYFSLFIRDVPAQAKEGDLRDLFKGFGAVAGVNIVTGRGYAFVDFVEQEAMRAALADSREFKLLDKVLQVEERSDRKEGQRGGFRSDSRGGRGGRGSYGARGAGGRSGERKEREDGKDKKPASSNGGSGGRGDRPARDKGARRGGRADGHSGRGE